MNKEMEQNKSDWYDTQFYSTVTLSKRRGVQEDDILFGDYKGMPGGSKEDKTRLQKKNP